MSADFRSHDRNSLDRITLKALFYSEDWVYIAVDAIAQPLSRVPWLVYRKILTNGKEAWVPDQAHPLNKLLEDPSPNVDAAAFKYMAFSEDALMGNAIMWYAREMNHLHLVPAEIVDYDFNNSDGSPTRLRVVQHDYGRTITQAILDLADVCHVMRPNTSNKFWGLSPFVPVQRSVKFQTYTTEFMNAFYQRGATPQAMLEMDRDANEQNAVRLLSKFEQAYSGRRNTRRTILLPKGVKFSPIDVKIADQQLIEMIQMYRENILNALHIPKHVVSLNEAGSLGSEEFKQALKYFWQATLIPITERFAGRMTRFFRSQLGPDRCIGFNFDDVEFLQDDKLKKAQLAHSLLQVMTVNEIRSSLFELPAVEGGDKIPSLQPQQPLLPFAGLSAENEKPSPAAQASEPVAKPEALNLNAETLKKYETQIKTTDSIVRAEESSKVKKQVAASIKMLDAQIEAASKALDESFKKKASFDEKEFLEAYNKLLEDMEPSEVDEYVSDYQPTMELGYRSQLSFVINGDDRQTVDALRAENKDKRRSILSDRGLMMFRSTGETTGRQAIASSKRILDDIAAGREESMTIAEIADSIRGRLAANAQGRATTIARTETLTAVSLGQQAMIEDAGDAGLKMKKVWLNAGDTRVRGNPGGLYPESEADHWSLHGEIVDADKKFSNGLMYPRDVKASASDSINCRCVLITVPSDELGNLKVPERENIPDRE